MFTREILLPFETIENLDSSGTGEEYSDLEPGLMVIARNEDLVNLDRLVTDLAKARLTAMN